MAVFVLRLRLGCAWARAKMLGSAIILGAVAILTPPPPAAAVWRQRCHLPHPILPHHQGTLALASLKNSSGHRCTTGHQTGALQLTEANVIAAGGLSSRPASDTVTWRAGVRGAFWRGGGERPLGVAPARLHQPDEVSGRTDRRLPTQCLPTRYSPLGVRPFATEKALVGRVRGGGGPWRCPAAVRATGRWTPRGNYEVP